MVSKISDEKNASKASTTKLTFPKNEKAPGTHKTFAEAVKQGAPKETNKMKLQKTLELLTKMMTDQLGTASIENEDNVDSSERRTGSHGEHLKGDSRRYRKGSRRS